MSVKENSNSSIRFSHSMRTFSEIILCKPFRESRSLMFAAVRLFHANCYTGLKSAVMDSGLIAEIGKIPTVDSGGGFLSERSFGETIYRPPLKCIIWPNS